MKPSGRPPFWAIAPVLIALAIAGGWTAFWFAASDHAAGLYQQWRSQQAREGVALTCGSEERGGYPFQFTHRCVEPRLMLETEYGPVAARAKALRLVALVYDPTRFIAELSGPVFVEQGIHAVEMDWDSAQMSVRVTADPNRPSWRQSDIAFVNMNATLSERGIARGVYTADRTELHFRPTPDADNSLDAAFSTVTPKLRIARAEALHLDSGEFIARVEGIEDTAGSGVSEWLRSWQQGGGLLEIVGLRLAAGEALSRTSGRLTLDTLGYPNGELDIVNANVDADALSQRDPLGLTRFALKTVTAVGAPAQIEGREGRKVTLRLDRGRVFVHQIAVMPLPRLF